MLGWLVILKSPPRVDGGEQSDAEPVLATWEVGLGGIEWLNRLVTQGKAQQVTFGGYPNRYTAAAKDVLPLLADGPPAYDRLPAGAHGSAALPGWVGKIQFFAERLAACDPAQALVIEAWDQS